MYSDEIDINKVDQQIAEGTRKAECENIVKILGNNYRNMVSEKLNLDVKKIAHENEIEVRDVDSAGSMSMEGMR